MIQINIQFTSLLQSGGCCTVCRISNGKSHTHIKHHFKFSTNDSRLYSLSYCWVSHSSSIAPNTDSTLWPAAEDGFRSVWLAPNENKSNSWSVAIEARLRLSAFTTVFAMFILNFCNLYQTHQNSVILIYNTKLLRPKNVSQINTHVWHLYTAQSNAVAH